MKISEMITNLQSFLEEHGDLDCYYAVDDEGNAYHEVYYEPSLYFITECEDVYQADDLSDLDEDEAASLKRICIIN